MVSRAFPTISVQTHSPYHPSCGLALLFFSSISTPPDALAEVGKKYGGGTKYKAVWGRMTQIKEYAKLINEAIDAGRDPIDVELTEAPKQGSHITDWIPFVQHSASHYTFISFHFISI